MKRRNFSFLLAMLLSIVTVPAFAYDAEVNGIYYDFSGTEATVTYLSTSSSSNKNAYSGSVVIPKSVSYNGSSYSVTSIGNYAFLGCSGLTAITIPNSVTSIGNSAFSDCSGLTSITIPNSVTSIGDYAFRDCSGLTAINIPNSVTSIGYQAFYNCSSLTAITIPNSVTSIGSYAFRDCSGLTAITVDSKNSKYDSRNNCKAIIETASNTLIAGCKNTFIPNSVTSIGNAAFYGCSGLTSITIPNRVKSIGDWAFYDCSGLTAINIPNSVTSIGSYAFYGTGWYNAQPNGLVYLDDWLLGYKGDKPTGKITIKSGTKGIAGSAFSDCSGLTAVTIPNSVTSIGDYAFNNCSGLTAITIPNSVTSIGHMAFYYCSGLTAINIPNSVTSIGDYAFYYCSGLSDLYCHAVDVPTTYSNTFRSSDISNATLHVPASSVNAYKNKSPWSGFKAIVPIAEDDDNDLQRYLDSLADSGDSFANGVYQRTFQNVAWQALYVPFAVSSSDWAADFDVAQLTAIRQYDDDSDGKTDRQELEAELMADGNLQANYPYLIRAKRKGATLTVNGGSAASQVVNTLNLEGDNITCSLTGNYSQLKGLKSARRYRMQGGSLSIPGSDTEVLLPYRWYMTISGSNAARELSVHITGEASTGVETVKKATQQGVGVYNLSGHKVNVNLKSLPKGVYIINNKKCVIK